LSDKNMLMNHPNFIEDRKDNQDKLYKQQTLNSQYRNHTEINMTENDRQTDGIVPSLTSLDGFMVSHLHDFDNSNMIRSHSNSSGRQDSPPSQDINRNHRDSATNSNIGSVDNVGSNNNLRDEQQ